MTASTQIILTTWKIDKWDFFVSALDDSHTDLLEALYMQSTLKYCLETLDLLGCSVTLTQCEATASRLLA